jgi:predicted transcriptional regulator
VTKDVQARILEHMQAGRTHEAIMELMMELHVTQENIETVTKKSDAFHAELREFVADIKRRFEAARKAVRK